ncbi:MAG: DUF998 domain-containing protein, partial [Solirubrobacteraceae bacterium]
AVRARTACGVVAGPLFVSAFTAIGARRAGYDWRRYPVSSLADGRGGWAQRANFVLAGALYCIAGTGLARSSRRAVGPPAVPALILAAGAGLIGSGAFVTDPVDGFPPSEPERARDGVDVPPVVEVTREGRLHNLFAIPIFAGIPTAALICAGSATRRREYRWAGYCAGSAVGMVGALVLFGAAFGAAPRLSGRGGVFQRISVATGFGWLSALSLRSLCQRDERL